MDRDFEFNCWAAARRRALVHMTRCYQKWSASSGLLSDAHSANVQLILCARPTSDDPSTSFVARVPLPSRG